MRVGSLTDCIEDLAGVIGQTTKRAGCTVAPELLVDGDVVFVGAIDQAELHRHGQRPKLEDGMTVTRRPLPQDVALFGVGSVLDTQEGPAREGCDLLLHGGLAGAGMTPEVRGDVELHAHDNGLEELDVEDIAGVLSGDQIGELACDGQHTDRDRIAPLVASRRR